ncbi:MAG: NADH-quinone oxidoreductase subunit I [Myxococcota bacterium]
MQAAEETPHEPALPAHDPHGHALQSKPTLPLALRVRKMFHQAMIALYLPSIFRGMARTFGFMFRPKETLQYPEEEHRVTARYRGEHRLKKDEQGRPKCVACFMCQTSCPAECITIVARDATEWPDRDKVPLSFDIDLLKCIYCGMCEEACPCDAIELTTLFTQVATSREQKKYDMQTLLMSPSERPQVKSLAVHRRAK